MIYTAIIDGTVRLTRGQVPQSTLSLVETKSCLVVVSSSLDY
jgi:hypothetical protein